MTDVRRSHASSTADAEGLKSRERGETWLCNLEGGKRAEGREQNSLNKRRVSVNDLAAAYCSPVQQGLTADMQIPLVACPSVPSPLRFSCARLQTRFHAEPALAETRRLVLYARSGLYLRGTSSREASDRDGFAKQGKTVFKVCNADLTLYNSVKHRRKMAGIFMAVVPKKKKKKTVDEISASCL